MSLKSENALGQTATVDTQSLQSYPNSKKIYVEGSRGIRVPMREIALADTSTELGGEKNAPVTVYDTSGPYCVSLG